MRWRRGGGRSREGEGRGSAVRGALLPVPLTPALLAGLLAPVLLAACGEPFTTTITDRTPFDPPAVYAEWWDETRACSGLDGNLGRISWFLATSIEGDGRRALGLWTPPHDIVLLQGYEDEPTVVRHEMLHDLLDGDREHRDSSWDDCRLAD